ncbi:MAG: FAD-containing monooxygenase EthA, partial [Pseudomonadota bacterium]
GYTNASWTLKSDLTTQYMCRLIRHMDKNQLTAFEVVNNDASVEERPFLDLSSGYVSRMMDKLPKQGSKAPWKLYQNYTMDFIKLKFERVNDDVVRFTR